MCWFRIIRFQAYAQPKADSANPARRQVDRSSAPGSEVSGVRDRGSAGWDGSSSPPPSDWGRDSGPAPAETVPLLSAANSVAPGHSQIAPPPQNAGPEKHFNYFSPSLNLTQCKFYFKFISIRVTNIVSKSWNNAFILNFCFCMQQGYGNQSAQSNPMGPPPEDPDDY